MTKPPRLSAYDTFSIPVADIHYDTDFNCRNVFTVESIRELADAIAQDGLTYPVLVQPWDQTPGKPYRLLAGHRRYQAVTTLLYWTHIPATVRDRLSDWEASKLNFLENLERKDLTIMEEAQAIAKLFPDGATIEQVKNELHRTTHWAYARLQLLRLPEEVQQSVASGRLLQGDIEQIARIKKPEEQLEVAQKLTDMRRTCGTLRGRKNGHRTNKEYRRPRTRLEINNMVSHMMECGISGLPTRVGAWCAGYIDDAKLKADIRADIRYAKKRKERKDA